MTIVEKVVKTATIKGKTIEFTFVKLDNGKWYKVIKDTKGNFILIENKGDENVMSKRY